MPYAITFTYFRCCYRHGVYRYAAMPPMEQRYARRRRVAMLQRGLRAAARVMLVVCHAARRVDAALMARRRAMPRCERFMLLSHYYC